MDFNILINALLGALIRINAIITITRLVSGTPTSSSILPFETTMLNEHIQTSLTHVDNIKTSCKLSEWKCLNETCISLSKFCDGIIDCLDQSDEPSHCSGKTVFDI